MQVEPFLIEPQRARDRAGVRQLLADAELVVDDLDRGAAVDFLVMREAGQVVGAVGLQSVNGEGLLRSLVVAPSLHRQGRGAALVTAIERLAAGRGIDELYLLTTSVPKFFALLDYLRIDRAQVPWPLQQLEQFRTACPRDAVVMRKRLRHSERA